jgi:Trk K+ transport system NAD-binding subunit
MRTPNRRTAYYLALVVVTTGILTVTYNAGMAVWEGESQPLYRSLEVVFQSFTTTGYGEDAPWGSLEMNVLVIVMQLTGIGLILTAADVFAVPWLRDALSPSVPESVSPRDGHVVICGHTDRTDVLVDELLARDREYVLIEADEERALALHQAGYTVIAGDPESATVLDRAHVQSAAAVVTDVADDSNASIALSATETAPDVQIVSLVEDAPLGRYHRIAGVDTVHSPRQLLGKRLAREVPTAVSTAGGKGVEIGESLELVELSVDEGSDLHGQRVAETDLEGRFGVTVVGAWFERDFETRLDPAAPLSSDTRLLVAGDRARLDELREATSATVSEFGPERVIVAGYGETGRAVEDALSGTAAGLTVLDVDDQPGVDVVGDARDPDVLESADIGSASVLILTVGDDTTAIFATLIATDLNPGLSVLVRATTAEDEDKLYRAGADYVEDLSTVSGRMLASTIFEDEALLAYDQQVSIVRLDAPGLAGQTLGEADVRERTGCSVVAVFRDGESITALESANLHFREDDEVVVAGSESAIGRFEREFGG